MSPSEKKEEEGLSLCEISHDSALFALHSDTPELKSSFSSSFPSGREIKKQCIFPPKFDKKALLLFLPQDMKVFQFQKDRFATPIC